MRWNPSTMHGDCFKNDITSIKHKTRRIVVLMHHEKDACLQSKSWSMKSSASWLDLSWEHSFQKTQMFCCPVKIYKWLETAFDCFWGHKNFSKWVDYINDVCECPTIANFFRCFVASLVWWWWTFYLVFSNTTCNTCVFLWWESWSCTMRKWMTLKGKLSWRWDMESTEHQLKGLPVMRVEKVSSLDDLLGTSKYCPPVHFFLLFILV